MDFEVLHTVHRVYVAGDRVYDLALRLQYADTKTHVEPELKIGIQKAIDTLPKDQTLFVLATYSAVLDIRKILLGHKIL